MFLIFLIDVCIYTLLVSYLIILAMCNSDLEVCNWKRTGRVYSYMKWTVLLQYSFWKIVCSALFQNMYILPQSRHYLMLIHTHRGIRWLSKLETKTTKESPHNCWEWDFNFLITVYSKKFSLNYWMPVAYWFQGYV